MFDRPRERAFFLVGCFARQPQLLCLILDHLPLNSYRKAGVGEDLPQKRWGADKNDCINDNGLDIFPYFCSTNSTLAMSLK